MLSGPGPDRAAACSDRVGRQHAERHRDAGVARGVGDAVRHRGRDVVEVRRFAADDAAEADDGVEAPGLGGGARRLRNLEGARDREHLDVGRARFRERRGRGVPQAAGHRLVEAGHDHREPERGRVGQRRRRLLLPSHRYLPLNSGLRFSRNAAVPSRMSSVLATRPKSVASKICACANGISSPLLHRLEDVADRDRRLGGQRRRELLRFRHQLRARERPG